MKVTFVADRQHVAIFQDEGFATVIEMASRSKAMQQFLGMAIRECETCEDIRTGRGGKSLDVKARAFLKGRRDIKEGMKLARLMERLYTTHEPGSVRGCLIEAMVQQRLNRRYGHASLENNVFVEMAGGEVYRSSTSVDVAGRDGERGECHDCKARAKRVDVEWIAELVENLVPFGFRIGVATAESAKLAMHAMQANGLRQSGIVSVVGPEGWWDELPLWQN